MAKPSMSFFMMNFVLLFLLTAFVLVVFELHTYAFMIEFVVLLAFISILAWGMFEVYRNKQWGWTVVGVVLVLLLFNTFFVFFIINIVKSIHIATVFFSVIGLIIVLVNLRREKPRVEVYDSEHKTKDYYPFIDKMEPEGHNVEKKFTPGKFVASKKATKFHSPKCDWAKRITKDNQIWFDSAEEAKKNGFKEDKCVI